MLAGAVKVNVAVYERKPSPLAERRMSNEIDRR